MVTSLRELEILQVAMATLNVSSSFDQEEQDLANKIDSLIVEAREPIKSPYNPEY